MPFSRSESFAGDNSVHIWTGSFSAIAKDPNNTSSLLGNDELERASRFVFDRDRNKYISGRAALRRLLGQYLSQPAGDLSFSYNDQGKPELIPESGGTEVTFNVAHAEDLLCFAIAPVCQNAQQKLLLGVDIEFIERDIPFVDVASSHFSEKEILDLATYDEKRLPFFRCWTRKEAYIKAHGTGVSYGLDQFGVSLLQEENSRPTFDTNSDVDLSNWVVHSWEPAPDYLGAVVVNRCSISVTHYAL